jgi:hypothetical protein
VRGEFREVVIELPVIVDTNLVLQLGIRHHFNGVRTVVVLVGGTCSPKYPDDL